MKMNKVLVHLHLYYHDQTDYFISKLKNISLADWDLVVTYTKSEPTNFSKLIAINPNTKFQKVENIGYDIWPFIYVIKQTDLSKYEYIIKLHTKRSVKKCIANVIPMRGFEWRDSLVDGVLYTSDYFTKILNKFENNPSIGMISNLKTYSKRNWNSYSPRVAEELDKLRLKSHENHFCMGTMFIARAHIFKPLQTENINQILFEDTINDQKRDFTSAHYYERLLSVLPSAMGYKHLPASPKKREQLIIKAIRILEKPVRWIFGIEKKGLDKRKFIRIFGIEFYIQKQK